MENLILHDISVENYKRVLRFHVRLIMFRSVVVFSEQFGNSAVSFAGNIWTCSFFVWILCWCSFVGEFARKCTEIAPCTYVYDPLWQKAQKGAKNRETNLPRLEVWKVEELGLDKGRTGQDRAGNRRTWYYNRSSSFGVVF